MMQRKLAQVSQDRATIVDQADTGAKIGVSGGFRAGKRKRGNSLLKKAPKNQAHAITFYVRDADGMLVGSVRTITSKREQ